MTNFPGQFGEPCHGPSRHIRLQILPVLKPIKGQEIATNYVLKHTPRNNGNNPYSSFTVDVLATFFLSPIV